MSCKDDDTDQGVWEFLAKRREQKPDSLEDGAKTWGEHLIETELFVQDTPEREAQKQDVPRWQDDLVGKGYVLVSQHESRSYIDAQDRALANALAVRIKLGQAAARSVSRVRDGRDGDREAAIIIQVQRELADADVRLSTEDIAQIYDVIFRAASGE